MKKPSEIDFAALPFGYLQTPFNIRCHYKDGAWGKIEKHSDDNVSIHIASTALHYGQQAFEGLKAFRGADGKIRVFRIAQNGERLQRSADYLQMAVPSIELFTDMVVDAVKANIDYVPPFESGGSLYIRPVLFGVGANMGVRPAPEYLLIVFVSPVGSYFKGGMKGIKVMIDRHHDRAGAHGTGHVKAGGNYASSMLSGVLAHDKGYDSALYLDPTEHKYVDEAGAANFFGIKNNTYVTPFSHSILPSITNMTLQQLAADMGMKVEKREIEFAKEIATFEEVGACGTAAVMTPIAQIDDPDTGKSYSFKTIGPVTQKLYDTYRAIQLGSVPDTHKWNTIIE